MKYVIEMNKIRKLDKNHIPEWILSNGLGGYSSSSVIGSNRRKQHGLLVASSNPPINRMLILAKIEEKIIMDSLEYDLSSQQFSFELGVLDTYLDRFELSEVTTFFYKVNEVLVKKTISPYYNHNAVAIVYEITTLDSPISIQFNPVFNYRLQGDVSTKTTLEFTSSFLGQILNLKPNKPDSPTIFFFCSEGTYKVNISKHTKPYYYEIDALLKDEREDTHYNPYQIETSVPAYSNKIIEMICSLDEMPQISARQIIKKYSQRANQLIRQAALNDEFSNKLVISGDQFISKRLSTGLTTILAGYPWFTDWGRDTMIAFEGLLLTTKRFHEAKEVLLSFQKYMVDGLIPNMFPDFEEKPLYNTADASLWYLHAVFQYLVYTNDHAFVQNELFESMKSVISNYMQGTKFQIGMDSDFLIKAGSGLDQVTWMDVRINGKVITPRHGKPVEINALWYNGLCVMENLSKRFSLDGSHYHDLALKVKVSFNERFWNQDTKCLFDVVDQMDPSIRPNQLFAISLPYSCLSKRKAKSVLKVATFHLLDIYGIRTLSLQDERFIPNYSNDLVSRDHAYHMGTSWGFLLGTYMEAYLKTFNNSKKSREFIQRIYERIKKHLFEGCLNGYAEVFDGLNGAYSKGCFTQAWSVAEILRVYETYRLSEGSHKNEN